MCDALPTYNDFDSTTCDFSGNLKGLEETGLLRSQIGYLSRDSNVDGRNGTGTSGSSDLKAHLSRHFGLCRAYLVLQQFIADGAQVFFGENEADVFVHVR